MERERAAHAEQERREYQAELREFNRLKAALGLTPISVPGFVTQKSEEAYIAMEAGLFEWKKERGHYEGGGGIRGVSFRVPGMKSMRAYYGGLSPRQYVPGPEGFAEVDRGTAVITSKRIVFVGAKKNVEWAFAKLVSVNIDENSSAMVLQVTNRQKSHVLQLTDLGIFTMKYEAAIARFQGQPAPTLAPPSPPASLPEEDYQPALPPPPAMAVCPYCGKSGHGKEYHVPVAATGRA